MLKQPRFWWNKIVQSNGVVQKTLQACRARSRENHHRIREVIQVNKGFTEKMPIPAEIRETEKIENMTYLNHCLHLVYEIIRKRYKDVDGIISNVKKIFIKSPTRISVYKEKLPNTPLPPKPILTRWDTCLTAAIFYANHFTEIKDVSIDLCKFSIILSFFISFQGCYVVFCWRNLLENLQMAGRYFHTHLVESEFKTHKYC